MALPIWGLNAQLSYAGVSCKVVSSSVLIVNESTEVVEIDIKRIKDSDHIQDGQVAIQSRYRSFGHLTPFSDYVVTLRKIQNEMKKNKTNPNRFKTVFYPLIGTDIVLPLVLFSKAKTIITMDRTPFLRERDITDTSPITTRDALGGPWRRGTHVAGEGEIAPRMIGALKEAFPKVKLISLTIYHTTESNQGTAISASLKFNLQDGVGVRELIYINENIGRYVYSRPVSSVEKVWSFNPDVVVFKAAEGIAFGELSKTVINKMRGSQGMIVEGTATEVGAASGVRDVYWPEVTERFEMKDLPNLHRGGYSYLIPNIDFAYNVGVLVTDFDLKKAD